MARNYKQGKYTPVNPKKYIGDPTNIVYRSGWEKRVFRLLDEGSNVVAWCSEEIVIPYRSPIDNKIHRYFVDVFVVAKAPDGTLVKTLIEIKPFAQTQPPVAKQGKRKDRLLAETTTYLVNQAKWKQAEAYCRQRGWSFKVLTEKDINFL